MDKLTYDYYIKVLEERLDKRRFLHSVGTMKMALKLAKRYNLDVEKARFAGLMHDIAKCLSKEKKRELAEEFGLELGFCGKLNPDLLHGAIGAQILKREFNITDSDILNAVSYHTTARAGMSDLEKIIYCADLIEETRQLRGIDKLRRFMPLSELFEQSLKYVLTYVIKDGVPLDTSSIEAYNELFMG